MENTTADQQSETQEQKVVEATEEVKMDRVITEVPSPPMRPMELKDLLDSKTGLPKLDLLKEHLLIEGRLTIEAANFLVDGAAVVLREEPNLLPLNYPLTVCGDVHGQFFDLVRLFEVGGDPAETQFLFLGDYVDRGCFSTECVFYLYAHKMVYPNSLFMLRGNHECRQLTAFFNFRDECAYKYNLGLYERIMDSFDLLPLAALINKSFFCVHGGLSPDIRTLDEIQKLDRVQEIPREGAMCDLLWADPFEEDQEDDSDESDSGGEEATSWFGYNDTRQCSYVYGIEAVKNFLQENNLTSVIRAHEAQIQGYKMQMVNKQTGIPRVITIFSAPNYCDVYKNKGACLKFDNNVLNIKQFVDSPHPYYLPNFMDVFQWSLPFVAEKVTDMLATMLDVDDEDSESEDEGQDDVAKIVEQDSKKPQMGKLKQKVLAMSKVMRMYRILKVHKKEIDHLKAMSPNHLMPKGLLQSGSDAIQQAINDFESARAADQINEKYPDILPGPGHRATASESMTYPAKVLEKSTTLRVTRQDRHSA